MQVNSVSYSPNFKQIKLSKQDAAEINYLIKHSKKTKSDKDKECCFGRIVDIFRPHIEYEAMSIDSTIYSVKDYMQELYLRLLESCTPTLRKLSSPASILTKKLNSMKPTEETKILLNDKQVEELTGQEEYRFLMESEKESDLSIVQRLINTTPDLDKRQENMLKGYLDGDSIELMGDDYELTTSRIRQIIAQCVEKIKLQHNKQYRKEYYAESPNLLNNSTRSQKTNEEIRQALKKYGIKSITIENLFTNMSDYVKNLIEL